jgi:putative transposase
VDVPESKPLPKTNQAVGIDFGISRLATLSTGEFVANPKYGSKYARKLARLQRELARKQKDSKRREKAKRRVARAHEKIANCREDTQNKLAIGLVQRFDTICIEDLNLRGMMRNHRLARALSDAAIGGAVRKLESKANQFGRKVIRIDRFFPSSKQCSTCGTLKQDMSLSVRNWTCDCGAVHDRDVNAAKNILAVGQTVFAHGAGVRAKRTTVRRASRRRSANPRVGRVAKTHSAARTSNC